MKKLAKNRINRAGIELIKHFESLRVKKYICPAGLATIGYGHVIKAGEVLEDITESTAEKLLYEDIMLAERAVFRNIHVRITSNQFSALVSFTFNVGIAALQRSTLRMKINNSEHYQVPKELMRWVYGGGIKLPGLIKRRKAEAMLYIR